MHHAGLMIIYTRGVRLYLRKWVKMLQKNSAGPIYSFLSIRGSLLTTAGKEAKPCHTCAAFSFPIFTAVQRAPQIITIGNDDFVRTTLVPYTTPLSIIQYIKNLI